jgi:hypothetical protein
MVAGTRRTASTTQTPTPKASVISIIAMMRCFFVLHRHP